MTRLNFRQRQAVLASGHTAVLAGPGTGKTTTLTAKAKHLLDFDSVPASQILILAFTAKAAAQIKTKLPSLKNIYTFHSFALHLLKNRFSDFKLVSPFQHRQIIHSLTQLPQFQGFASLSYPQISLLISKTKIKNSTSEVEEEVGELTSAYQQQLKKLHLLDFDDLILKAIQLKKFPAFSYILVDEFQDTNLLEYKFLKKIALASGSTLFVIGDPHQSIYTWRGADSSIFTRFQKDFRPCLIDLQTNYRSPQTFLNTAHRLFPQSQLLVSSLSRQPPVQLIQTLDQYTQASWIINFINQQVGGVTFNQASRFHHQSQPASFSDFAILYRYRHHSHILKAKLLASNIPFQTLGDQSPYLNSPSVKIIIACLDYLIGQNPQPLIDLNHHQLLPFLPSFSSLSPVKFIQKITALKKLNPDPPLQQLSTIAYQFQALTSFYNYWQNLAENNFYQSQSDQITLTTIHAAKGLEFAYVFLIFFQKDHFPPKQKPSFDLSEEKRLLYVALTRAQKGLFLLSFGPPSPFFKLIQGRGLKTITDPNIQKIQLQRRRRRLRHAQASLF